VGLYQQDGAQGALMWCGEVVGFDRFLQLSSDEAHDDHEGKTKDGA
jgi:hypothetical protein